jgi:hypothetical protein
VPLADETLTLAVASGLVLILGGVALGIASDRRRAEPPLPG